MTTPLPLRVLVSHKPVPVKPPALVLRDRDPARPPRIVPRVRVARDGVA